MTTTLMLVGCLLFSHHGMAAQREVDLELVLAVDISRSMDLEEAALVRQGFVRALRHPDVIAAIERGPLGRIAVTYAEWGTERYQRTRVDWTEVSGAASAAAFAVRANANPNAIHPCCNPLWRRRSTVTR